MNILIITNSCEIEKYKIIERERTKRVLGAQQKFFNFVIKGLADDHNSIIDVLTVPPVSASSHPRYIWKSETSISNVNVRYHYLGFANGKISRYITQYCTASNFIHSWVKGKDNKNSVIICDPLIVHVTLAVHSIANKRRIKTIGIVTDLPVYVTEILQSKLSIIKHNFLHVYDYLTDNKLKKYGAYVLLTKQMNDVVNPKKKPYMIMEGISDSNINIRKVEKEHICIYAGGIFEQFGVVKLAKAFAKTKRKDWQLHFYGTGNDIDKLKAICAEDNRIEYKGTVAQSDIVDIEARALLLVNPRPSAEEFTAYSFPSKTTEYLSSGTAVLSTRLPGIPEDYYPYIYWIDDESESAITERLNSIFDLNDDELIAFGMKGQKFIIENKGYLSQGKRLRTFIDEIIKE